MFSSKVTVFVLLVLTRFSVGSNQEVSKMSDALKDIAPGTLVVFDIDNTILQTRQTLGSVQWHDWYTKELRAAGDPEATLVETSAQEWIRVQRASKSELVEEETAGLIRNLQKRKIPVIALTARPFDEGIVEQTIADLHAQKIHLERSWDKHTRFESPFKGAFYSQGILFAGQTNSKGLVFGAFLSQNRLNPKIVRFIDDKAKYLDSVGPVIAAKKIRFEGFRYGGADNRVKAFDSKLARLQTEFFNKTGVLLDDKTAQARIQKEIPMKKALIVVTSHETLGNTGKKTGYYLPEVTHPYFAMAEQGIEVDIASPKGGKAPMDESSRNLNDEKNRRFLENPILAAKLENTIPLQSIKPETYDAILFAGGHGTMYDFPDDNALKQLTAGIFEKGGVVAAVCHGPAALVNVTLSSGEHLVKGKKLAAFTNEEEEIAELTKVMPFLLETGLVQKGALIEKSKPFAPKVVVDGRLVSGQNPASAKGVGEAVAQLLS